MCSPLTAEIASEAILNTAYDWVCRQRRDYPSHADIWDLRWLWKTEKLQLIQRLRANQYQFFPNQAIPNSHGKTIHLWFARDALVLKAMSLVLEPKLPISPRCTHVKGQGGIKAHCAGCVRS